MNKSEKFFEQRRVEIHLWGVFPCYYDKKPFVTGKFTQNHVEHFHLLTPFPIFAFID